MSEDKTESERPPADYETALMRRYPAPGGYYPEPYVEEYPPEYGDPGVRQEDPLQSSSRAFACRSQAQVVDSRI